MSALELDALSEALSAFVAAREWEQFYSLENPSMAITVEAAGLADYFVWTDPQDPKTFSPEKREQAELQVADLFLVRSAPVSGNGHRLDCRCEEETCTRRNEISGRSGPWY
jgi:hypothetical protein